ncbi:MAG: exuT [Gammaproteobacteria bacterium]|nr:exuT [Gammaproteobacteria bacterium]
MSQTQQQSEAPAAETHATSYKPWYLYYVLGVLFIGYVFNSMDRAVLNVLLESIKQEFGVSDKLLGFLGGFTFAAFYATMGIPIAAIADRTSRVNVLSVCISLWSIMTALCGTATQFIYLLFARIGTAVGEAGGTPPSHSLISDYFPINKRASAISIYMLGIPIGMSLGLFFGGWLNEIYDWRIAFIAIGMPGVLIGILIKLTVKEPPRGYSDKLTVAQATASAPSMLEVFKYLWNLRAFRNMCLGNGLHSFVWYGGSIFNATYFMRSHEMSSGEAGTILSTVALVGIIGTFFGGVLADKLSVRANDKRWYLLLPAIVTIGMLPFQFSSYLGRDLSIVIPSFYIMMILASIFFSPTYAMAQALAPMQMRARATSIVLFMQTLIGLGLGPFFVGWISDLLADSKGQHSLAWGLVIVGLVNIWAAWHYFLGSKTLVKDLERTASLNKAFAS